MRDLKFIEASAISWKIIRDGAVTSGACNAAAQSFKSNVDRVLGIISLPGYTTWVTTEWNNANFQAQKEVVGFEASHAEIEARLNEIGARALGYLVRNMNSYSDQSLMLIQMTKVFESNVVRSRPDMHAGVESLLKTVLIQIWTAFEVLAQELWEGVINEHPHHLAGLDGKGGESSEHSKSNLGKHVPLFDLHKHGYDLSGVMGTMLKEKFNFTVLGGMRRAYFSAFASDRGEIEKIISDKNLDALAAVRHLLVHRAGVIDEGFMEDSEGIPALDSIRSLGLKKPILIEGVLVRTLVEPVLNSGSALVYEVDRWLNDHPNPP